MHEVASVHAEPVTVGRSGGHRPGRRGAEKGGGVAPRPGGETDKFGNRYEGAWAIRHALYVLLGSGTSLCVEPGGPLGEGIEFVYRHDHGAEVHQVKRQNRNANSWNVASLRDKGVWESLRSHVDAGRMFHFVSVVPARALDELADRALGAVPYQLFLMVPYVLSIVALVLMSRRARVPQALMQPYRRGER